MDWESFLELFGSASNLIDLITDLLEILDCSNPFDLLLEESILTRVEGSFLMRDLIEFPTLYLFADSIFSLSLSA